MITKGRCKQPIAKNIQKWYNARMNAIMSIKKEFSQKILKGEKLYEFRKSAPTKAERIFIYETSSTKRIVGSFKFVAIKDTPQNLWQKFAAHAGISVEAFFEYYKGYNYGYALKIVDLRPENINPYNALKNFTPPQDYVYTEEFATICGVRK